MHHLVSRHLETFTRSTVMTLPDGPDSFEIAFSPQRGLEYWQSDAVDSFAIQTQRRGDFCGPHLFLQAQSTCIEVSSTAGAGPFGAFDPACCVTYSPMRVLGTARIMLALRRCIDARKCMVKLYF
jgi:hypothetical protein